MRRRPGYRWRTLAWDESREGMPAVEQKHDRADRVRFDELVIDDWFHLEQMDDRRWWMCVGDLHVNIHVRHDGRYEISGWADRGSVEAGPHGFRVVED